MEINGTFLTIVGLALSIIIFFSGVWVSNYFQNRENKREKIIDVDKNILKELRSSVDQNLRFLKEKNLFDYQAPPIRINNMFRSDNFEHTLLKSDIYEKTSDSLILSYKKDKILKRHSPNIVGYLESYRDNIKELERIIGDIDFEKYYGDLEKGIEPLLIKIERNLTDLKNIQNEKNSHHNNLQMIIVSILFDNPRLFPNGTTARLDLLKMKYKETQEIVFQNQDLKMIAVNIAKIRENLIINLEALQTELKELHNGWRDQYHI